MKIVPGFPPNIEEIRRAFDIEGRQIVFAYGNFLYNPTGLIIPDHLMAHEETHERQQVALGSIDAWWRRYLHEPAFRLEQEIEAYREQYRYVKRNVKDRNAVARFLHAIAIDLAGPIYGNITSYAEASSAISK